MPSLSLSSYTCTYVYNNIVRSKGAMPAFTPTFVLTLVSINACICTDTYLAGRPACCFRARSQRSPEVGQPAAGKKAVSWLCAVVGSMPSVILCSHLILDHRVVSSRVLPGEIKGRVRWGGRAADAGRSPILGSFGSGGLTEPGECAGRVSESARVRAHGARRGFARVAAPGVKRPASRDPAISRAFVPDSKQVDQQIP